jgi:hypothetical protein
VVRRGRDAEGQIGIDHGVLRFRPLITPGWGRQGIAYGPFRRASGLTFAVAITNGHNTSQGSATPEGFLKRVARWAIGPNDDPPLLRGVEWLLGPRKRGTLRRLRWWAAIAPKAYRLPEFNENLALGWFAGEAPGEPSWDGCYFTMHAALGDNGELWARVGGRFLRAFRGVRNIRIYYVAALRERGAIYYAAAVEGASGFAALPKMRPVAIDAFDAQPLLYAGIHQCALGQIGWRVDTLTHALGIAQVPELGSRFSTAHVGESFTGGGRLGDVGATERLWTSIAGSIALGDAGATVEGAGDAMSATDPGEASGLLHAIVSCDAGHARVGLIWRLRDPQNYVHLRLTALGCALVRVQDGSEEVIAADAVHPLAVGVSHSVQILDHEGQIGCYLDGERLFDTWLDADAFEDASGVGLWFGGEGGATVRDFEAHPRAVPMPGEFAFTPAWSGAGGSVAIADSFPGEPGDLAGRSPTIGDGKWLRSAGRGCFEVTGGGGVRVRGSVEAPHPGRTFYTLPWSSEGFADLEVAVTPPGHRRGDRHRGRAGLVFWQDRRNFLTLSTWLDDIYDGASISVFPKRHGFEELYDAVWTMVGHKVDWGKPFRLRCAFDGDNFTIRVDEEPIMQRALSDLYPDDPPLRIRRVGIATNWEWGCDTGSQFSGFVARR